ncbi:hypothetical protein ACIQ2D_04735 [Lysinibacillus sp. NPDC097287]|uniref:phosphotriesterase family protein n=1 Tax=Lysinibacillus sp. NPDC097287 TaxID=3364144 RepID=UPI0037FB9C59
MVVQLNAAFTIDLWGKGGPGVAYALSTLKPKMKELGLTVEQIDAIFIDNPAQSFAFKCRKNIKITRNIRKK